MTNSRPQISNKTSWYRARVIVGVLGASLIIYSLLTLTVFDVTAYVGDDLGTYTGTELPYDSTYQVFCGTVLNPSNPFTGSETAWCDDARVETIWDGVWSIVIGLVLVAVGASVKYSRRQRADG